MHPWLADRECTPATTEPGNDDEPAQNQPRGGALELSPQPWEGRLISRLHQHAPNIEAMLELYDQTATQVWSYALYRTGSRARAKQVTIAAFLTAAHTPQVFDGRISMTARMLLIVQLQTQPQPTAQTDWISRRLDWCSDLLAQFSARVPQRTSRAASGPVGHW